LPVFDMQPALTETDVLQLFDELGHISPSILRHVKDIMEECGLQNKELYSFGEFYTLLLIFCRDRGF